MTINTGATLALIVRDVAIFFQLPGFDVQLAATLANLSYIKCLKKATGSHQS